jgi:para-aminobenzoate synthetase component 1
MIKSFFKGLFFTFAILEINMIGKNKIISLMNEYGKKRRAFFFMISFDMNKNLILGESELRNSRVFYKFPNHTRTPLSSSPLPEKIVFKKNPIGFDDFEKAFHIAKKNLDFGNTYLINLTKPTAIETNLSFHQIFEYSKAKYKLFLEDRLVVFSPETFVKIQNGQIASYPMKGTIDAAILNADTKILTDIKETAEHNTIVDLIRNDLSIVSKNVRLEKFRYIDKIKTADKTLLQVSSKIVGDIDDDFFDCLGDRFFALLPAGSISGAPKAKTLEIIKEAEDYDRGFYTGVFGYFDGKNLDSAVMIRYIEQQGDRMVFKSGGGITTFSDCQKEYEEMKDKVYLSIF